MEEYKNFENHIKKYPADINLSLPELKDKLKFNNEYLLYKYIKQYRQEYNVPNAKILIIDIETAPLKGYVWSRWKQNMYLNQTISEWFMLSWSAKWLGSTEIMGEALTSEEAIIEDDKRIVNALWLLLDIADIVVAHNGDYFDIPKINTRFILHDLKPPSPYHQVDTLKVARRRFKFSSNSLDSLATHFNFDSKIKVDFQLWKDCLNGDKVALDKMLKYNKQDVVILEKVYLKLLPWINNHPNLGLYSDYSDMICSHCGSFDIHPTEKFITYATTKYKVFRCSSCGGLSRSRVNQLNAKNNKHITRTL